MPETKFKIYKCKCNKYIDSFKLNTTQNIKQMSTKKRRANILARRARFTN